MIRTRIAPSPTGFPHIGTIYQAMLDKAYAKKHQGQFFIRIEDTDRQRFVEGAEDKIYQALDWFGLTEDISPRKPDSLGPYRQSERLAIYQQYAQQLIKKGKAYYCFCTKERLEEMRKKQQQEKKPPLYDQTCRYLSAEMINKNLAKKKPYVIRMKIPKNQQLKTKDLIHKNLVFNTKLIDDQVILKSDGYPTYHLAVVVDDHLMKTTHVVRGPEWLPSYPKHVLLYQYFGFEIPKFIHTPLITNMDGTKMSKRHGHANVDWYRQNGFFPEAILNFLALLGWSHPQKKEIFSFQEFSQHFDFKDLNPVSPKFNLEKLSWLNGEYIRKMPKKELAKRIKEYLLNNRLANVSDQIIADTIPLVQTRMKTLADYWPLVKFIFEQPSKVDFTLNLLKQHQQDLFILYEQLTWQHQTIYKETEQFCQNRSIKPIKLFMELRYCLSNQKVTAPLFEAMELIGKAKTLKRLKQVLS